MRLPVFLASKYYFSKSRKSFVNRISALAILIIALMIIAEIVVLSVFNGFTDQLKDIHRNFDSDLEIKPKEGKVFALTSNQLQKIKSNQNIAIVSKILEDDAILDYKDHQDVVRFKGVEQNFFGQNSVEQNLDYGDVKIFSSDTSRAVVGIGIEYKFDINLKNQDPIRLMYPNRHKKQLKSSPNSYQDLLFKPVGIFKIGIEYDERYLFIPLESAKTLTGYENELTSLEIKLKNLDKSDETIKSLEKILGEKFIISDREKRHESIYKAIQVEKIIAYLIFILILFIASLNLYAAVSMLVLSKRKDIETLNTLGADKGMIQKIFLTEAIFIILSGMILGFVLAFVLVTLQDKVGLVGVPEPNLQLNSIPVKMLFQDFVVSGVLTLLVSLAMIIRPVISSSKDLT